MIPLLEFEKDLGSAENLPPEDKKHMVFSTLTPESIMVFKRIARYCA